MIIIYNKSKSKGTRGRSSEPTYTPSSINIHLIHNLSHISKKTAASLSQSQTSDCLMRVNPTQHTTYRTYRKKQPHHSLSLRPQTASFGLT